MNGAQQVFSMALIFLLALGLILSMTQSAPTTLAAPDGAAAQAQQSSQVLAETQSQSQSNGAAAGAAAAAVGAGQRTKRLADNDIERVIASAKIHLTEADSGSRVSVPLGAVVAIRLKENRTTGYGWQLENPSDPTITGAAAVVGDALQLGLDKSVKSTKQLIGAGGSHVFLLAAKNVGESVVHAAYRRPWLPVTDEPASVFTVTVDVTAQPDQ